MESSQILSAATIPTRATRVRFVVVGFAVTLAMVTYLDRVCISSAADEIRHDLSLSQTQLAYVFSAFAVAYAFYFCITWLPTYLKEQHHITREMLGIYAGMPLALSVLGDLFGGIVTDRLCKRFGLRVGRAGLGAVAYALAAGTMLIATTASRPIVAIIALSIAVAAVMFTLGAAGATCIDIGGHHTGVVSALMNTAGNTGAIFSPIVAIYAKDHLGGWNAPLYVIAGLFLTGAVCWCLIDPRKRVFD